MVVAVVGDRAGQREKREWRGWCFSSLNILLCIDLTLQGDYKSFSYTNEINEYSPKRTNGL